MPTSRPGLDDDERRRRLVRHGLVPGARAASVEEATERVVCLHATEPPTVPLSLHARVDDLTREEVEAALVERRTLVRQLAMRRTLFVFPRDLLPVAWGSAAARTGANERAKLARDVVRGGITTDGDAWLASAERAVLAALDAAPDGLTALELKAAAPEIDVRADLPSSQVSPGRVLTVLGAEASIVRGPNTQHWRLFRPRWQTRQHWLGPTPEPLASADGYAELVRRWLARFGPGTETDVVWWLGATKTIVRAALDEVGAVPVDLDSGEVGWVLPDDTGPTPEVQPWAALLPVLDPTVMGWKQRDWYLGEHGPALFDRNGNAGTTAWWAGRVVGCWVQDADGVVQVRPLEPLPAEARAALREEAARLTAWLSGERVSPIYRAPTMTAEAGDLPYPPLRA
ncbi:winged helix DNA-binding domain-containing protein [Nocardioides bruguierae]|uniref:winged helix DNA-binding domain-containing protein n=1 Tax=Nocardioides bruguierae TaxID=2945102 RepID=UPI0020206F8B|nr:winged helix DNA-binding domain-containing protein [Nocardioides bruguierae]MCL8026495.1 winged helix DNA-binding domain-containing protein [Nocardioides bruguierae]